MHKIRNVITIGLMLAGALIPAFAWQKTPTIVFENLTKDFGNVTQGDELKVVFKFSNKGQGTLEIKSVEPG
jgi:hypothetical protein